LWTEYAAALYQKDILAAYEWKGQRINGIIRDVAPNGLLQFEFENEIHSVNLKEIKYCG
jgi:hypothetical protein